MSAPRDSTDPGVPVTPLSRSAWAAPAATWAWRLAVLGYIVFTILRGSEAIEINRSFVQVAQFGVVAAGLAIQVILARPSAPPRAARVLLLTIVLYLLVAAASTFVSIAPATTVSQLGISVLMFAFLAWNALARWNRATAMLEDLAWVVFAVAGAQVAGLLLLAFDPDAAIANTANRYTGVFVNANFSGVVSSIGIALGVYLIIDGRLRVLRWPLAVALFPLAVTLYLSGSRAAAIGTVLAIGVMLLIRFRRLVPRLAIIVATVGIAVSAALTPVASLRPHVLSGEAPPVSTGTPADDAGTAPPQNSPANDDPAPDDAGDTGSTSSPVYDDPLIQAINVQTSGRVSLYLDALETWLRQPVLGHGFRNAALAIGGAEAHNVVLGVLVETGIVGLVFPIGVLVAVIVLLRDRRSDLMLAAAMVAVLLPELTSASTFGWGGPMTLPLWTVMFAAFMARRTSATAP